jgi:hypothetical protein
MSLSGCLAIVTGSYRYIYTCNQCLSLLSISVRVPVVLTMQLNRIKLTNYPSCFSEFLFYFCIFYLLLVCLVPNVTCVSRLSILDHPAPLVCSNVYLRQVDCFLQEKNITLYLKLNRLYCQEYDHSICSERNQSYLFYSKIKNIFTTCI